MRTCSPDREWAKARALASQGRVQGEPTGRAIIVTVIERVIESRERKRDEKRQREGETYERRETHERRERDTREERDTEERERWRAMERLLSKRSRVYVQNARVLCDTGVLNSTQRDNVLTSTTRAVF